MTVGRVHPSGLGALVVDETGAAVVVEMAAGPSGHLTSRWVRASLPVEVP